MTNTELAKGVYWVGGIDWNIRDMHGYSTYRGTTYNAFLIIDEKITLVDTVKHPFKDELIERIKTIVPPEKIDYLVINHVEMDHTGSLPEIVSLIKPEKIFCSPMGHKALLDHFHQEDWPYEIVKSGTELSLGKRTLQFIETRMLHWPDSMFSYLKEDGILFSSDAFGQHYATSERFDDEVPMSEVMEESAKYYANILYLFSPLVKKLLASVAEMNLDIKQIAPDHGIIWRSHIPTILEAYEKWSAGECTEKALVVYDTMWNSTEKMAKAIAAGIEETGVSTEIINLRYTHYSDVMTKVLTAKAVVVGCPTLNNGILPRMAAFLMYMRGLKPLNKIGAAFSSFGWSGESLQYLKNSLEEMKIELVDDGYRHKYVPNEKALEACTAIGNKVGAAVKGIDKDAE